MNLPLAVKPCSRTPPATIARDAAVVVVASLCQTFEQNLQHEPGPPKLGQEMGDGKPFLHGRGAAVADLIEPELRRKISYRAG